MILAITGIQSLISLDHNINLKIDTVPYQAISFYFRTRVNIEESILVIMPE